MSLYVRFIRRMTRYQLRMYHTLVVRPINKKKQSNVARGSM